MRDFICYNSINTFIQRDEIMSFVKFSVGDTLVFKKKHPCGSDRFTALRGGTDIRIKCQGCAHELFLPRETAEKSIKSVIPQSENNT